MQDISSKYTHIKGWGVDADPKNEPTYPMKHYNGEDHKRLHYARPPLQPLEMEVLHSIERPNISATFGATVPPSGLSGSIRRMAFRYSENQLRHWFALILADRVNALEGVVDDLAHGHVPNIFAERGWNAEWKYNRKSFVTKLAVCAAVTTAVTVLLVRRAQAKRSEA